MKVFRFVIKIVLVCLCTLSLFSMVLQPKIEDYKSNHGHPWEVYDSSYFSRFQNVNDIIVAADKQFPLAKINSIDYYNFIASIIRKRFYHGYSYYTTDNPLAFFAGKVVWSDLAAIVNPEDIMKRPNAACSQQALILMEIFRRKGITYRKVGFEHHFATEGWIEGQWRYFDTDMEPDMQNVRKPLEAWIAENKFDSIYRNVIYEPGNNYKLAANHFYGEPNANPTPNALFLHRFCNLLISKYFLLLIVVLLALTSKKRSLRFRKEFKPYYQKRRMLGKELVDQ